MANHYSAIGEHKYRRKDRTIPENPVEISAIHLIYGVPIKTSHGANNSPAASRRGARRRRGRRGEEILVHYLILRPSDCLWATIIIFCGEGVSVMDRILFRFFSFHHIECDDEDKW